MEGISHEAASLAGHLRLGRLIALYDDNGISIDGQTGLSCSDNAGMRFEAYGWQVLRCDGHDRKDIYAALVAARAERTRPSLILCRTHIGFGSPRQDSAKAHGEPLGDENVQQTKAAQVWPSQETFYVPPEVRTPLGALQQERAACRRDWQKLLENYRQVYPEPAAEWEQWLSGELPKGWYKSLAGFSALAPEATRAASGRALERLAQAVPWLVGGSADLTPSNNTRPASFSAFSEQDYSGRYIHFGVREHGMGAILNGLALHGLRPYGGTFLVFADYLRPAIRMAAMMRLPVVYVFTHDSIGVGEDGPTHQPVEQLMSLRAIPNLAVNRPADCQETAAAWRAALERSHGPTAVILTRQALPQVSSPACGLAQGAYIAVDAPGGENPQVILAATGSEVSLALAARQLLQNEGLAARVVSLPSWELFSAQPAAYRERVFPPGIPVFAVEAGITQGWAEITGRSGAALGINRFGASGPAEVVFERLGLTAANLAGRVKDLLGS